MICLKLKVEVFIVSDHGPEFKRRECTSYYNVKFRKSHTEKIHENELNTLFLFTEVKVAEVKAAEW